MREIIVGSRLLLLSIAVGTFQLCGPAPASAEWKNSLQPRGKPAVTVTLARDGKTDYVIVIPSESTSQERKAAEELALWLGEMTGASFPIVPDSTTPRETEISIGRTSRLRNADVPQARADLGDDGYAICLPGTRVGNPSKRLYLLGGQKRGPLNAVYAFLEEDLGCRWYPTLNTTAESWLSKPGTARTEPADNRIPHTPTLRFRLMPRTYVPQFVWRQPAYTNAFDPTWALRNRTHGVSIPEELGGDVDFAGFCHEMGRLVPDSEYFKEHPEYYCERGGKRQPRQLCMTSSGAVKVLTENLLRRLRKSPHVEFADVSPNDGGGHCTCTDCKALNEENGGRPSGSQIYFVNQVAEAVEKEFPNVKILTAAYLDSFQPPTKIRPRKNVAIFLASDSHTWLKPLIPFSIHAAGHSELFRQAVIGWRNIADTMLICDYAANFQHYFAPLPNLHVLEPSNRFYAEHDVDGIYWLGIGYITAGEFAPLRTWVIAKSLWDPRRSVDDLIEDFIWGYYGDKVASAIIEYRALLERVSIPHRHPGVDGICFSMTKSYPNAPFLTRAFIEESTAIFDRALELDLRPEVRRRVEVAKLPLTYVKLAKGGGVTNEPWLFQTDEDYAALVKEFKAIVVREKITHHAEHVPISGWLTEKEAQYSRLPESVVCDLYQSLGQAQVENCRMFKGTSIEKDGQPFIAVLQHPPETGVGDATYKVPLPAPESGKELALRFGTSIKQATVNGIGFTVLVDGQEIWSREQKDRAPVDHQLDLAGWAGKTISLTLRVDALGNSAYDWSCWVRPQITFTKRP